MVLFPWKYSKNHEEGQYQKLNETNSCSNWQEYHVDFVQYFKHNKSLIAAWISLQADQTVFWKI